MNVSGVSLLASRLKAHARQPSDSVSASSGAPLWQSHESIKLGDSITGHPSDPMSIEYMRCQLDMLISQTNEQEKSLLRFQDQMRDQTKLVEELKARVIKEYRTRLQYKLFLRWKRLVDNNHQNMVVTPRVTESVNLNETLRHLAMSLRSPSNDDSMHISTHSSINVPVFKTARRTVKHSAIGGS